MSIISILSTIRHAIRHCFFKLSAIAAFVSLILFLIYSWGSFQMKGSINPSNVRWQYFFLDKESGKIITQTDIPEGKKTIAIINGATFSYPKSETPKLLKKNIARILTPENADLCVALPYEDLAIMQKYYGKTEFVDKKTGERVEDVYVTLRMHDDLAQGNDNFLKHESRFEGTMPAKEGAEQLASAIENGYDIWSYNSGGNSLAPKLELCEEYFAKNFDRLRHEGKLTRKIKYIGFSNLTTMAFHLRGLVDYAMGYGVAYSFDRIDRYPEDDTEKSLRRQVSDLLRVFKGEDVAVTRNFKASDIVNFSAAKARYEEAVKLGAPINHLAVWLGQLVPVTMAKLPKFSPDEKIILELEYMQEAHKGYEAASIVERFFKSGAIKAENILFIALGDFINYFHDCIPRENGLIPAYETLLDKDQEQIREFTKSYDLKVNNAYINLVNERSIQVMAEVTVVAYKYGVPVIPGGERRVGHGKYSQLAPSAVVNLKFDEATLSVTETSLLKAAVEVNRDLIVGPRKMIKHDGLAIAEKSDPALLKKIDEAKIMPLVESTISLTAEEDVVIGMPIDLATLDSSQIEGKGVVVYLPMVDGSHSSSEQFNAFQLSENYKKAKFVILLSRFPESYKADEERSITNRNDNYRKLIADLRQEGESNPAVFISRISIEIDNFEPFFHKIDLNKMLSSNTLTKAEAVKMQRSVVSRL